VELLIYIAAVFIATCAGVWLAARFVSDPAGERSAIRRRMARRLVAPLVSIPMVVSLGCAWLIVRGHPAVGIAGLAAVLILPTFVRVATQIRKSRKRANAVRIGSRSRKR
jgi:hypothetical protein